MHASSIGHGCRRPTLILLTGPPGVGKTTVCCTLASILTAKNCPFDGFYTKAVHAIAPPFRRVAFKVISYTTPPQESWLARSRDSMPEGEWTEPTVGKYCVYPESFERVALPRLTSNAEILIIDEIGKMELFSDRFAVKIQQLIFDAKRKARIVATVPEIERVPQRHLPFFRKLYACQESEVITVTWQNAARLPLELSRLFTS